MADLKISQLNSLAGTSLANNDVVAVVDTSASETKKITSKELVQYGYGLVDPSTLDGDIIEPGTTSARGTVQLTNSTSSTSTTTAATPNAVKSAYDLANAAMPKAGGTFTGNISFEGSTDDAFETTFAITDPTADRTITFKNESGTVAYLSDISSISTFLPLTGGTMTGQILGDDSTSASTPGYAFDGDPDTGLLRTGANELGLVTGGTSRLTIDASGNVVIPGNFTVQGTTTTIDTTTLVVEDKNIEMGAVATPTDVTADGGGITLKGTTDKTINWIDATDAWTSSERFSVPTGTAGAPSLTFTGDPNTGVYSPGADQVAISTNGTGRLFVDASGRVGIGKTPDVAAGVAYQIYTSGASTSAATGNAYFGLESVNRNSVIELGSFSTGTSSLIFANQASMNAGGVASIAGDISNQAVIIRTGGTGAGTERLRITSAGLVGIGTSSPGQQLSVTTASSDDGIVLTNSSANGGRLRLNSTGTGGRSYHVVSTADGSGAGGGKFVIFDNTASDAARLVINSSGNVGIGTTSPNNKLEVVGAGYFTDWVYTGSGSGSRGISSDSSTRALLFGVNGSEVGRFDTSGRLLVGTSTGYNDARLQVVGNTGGDPGRIDIRRNADNPVANSEIGTIRFSDLNGASGQYATIQCFADAASTSSGDLPGRLVFSVTQDGQASPTEAMRIINTREVCIGTTSAHAPNRNALENATAGQLTFRHSGATAGRHNIVGMTVGSAFVVADATGLTGVQLAYSGTSWSTLSDERHKTDLMPIDDGLAKVGSLRAVTGRLVTDPESKSRSFLIAQDVQAVLPQAVDTTDPDALALSYTEVIPLLVAALKESKERIETLEAKVAALESA